MKLQSDIPRAQRLMQALSDMVNEEGDTTAVNGVSRFADGTVLKADWVEKAQGPGELKLEGEAWNWPVYEVNFAGRAVLDNPFRLAIGSVISWVLHGWNGVVQPPVYIDSSGDFIIGVTCNVLILLWNHTCDLYKIERNTNSDGIGTPGNEQIIKVASNVSCHFAQTGNIDDPTGVARIKRPNIFTSDILYLPIEQEVEDSWWIYNTTRNADGSPAATFGNTYSVLGAPQIITSMNKQSVLLAREEKLPTGIA